jgi:hypothetical protein
MRDENAQQLLAKVMNWQDEETVLLHVPNLQLLADYKYDHYQRFSPGKRFIENLALWLNQFDARSDRAVALDFVMKSLVYFSEKELSHLVQTAHPDLIMQERIRLVAEEQDIPPHRVGTIIHHPRFKELGLKSLYLGLSDGARTNELRRASDGEISNEQIWQAYELGAEKIEDMATELKASLDRMGFASAPKFNLIWLLDDFSGSGNTYIRFDGERGAYKGKIKKIYEHLHRGELVDRSHYEVFLLLYVATRQAIDHIEYWAERFTSENGYKPLQVRVLCPIEREVAVTNTARPGFTDLLEKPEYCDQTVVDKHFLVGGTNDARLGFAGCALPVVLSHNTPNNSIYILWGPEAHSFFGLFPRVSRHREF